MTELFYSLTGQVRVVERWNWYVVQRRRRDRWTEDGEYLREWHQIGMSTRKLESAIACCGSMGEPSIGHDRGLGKWI